MPHWCDVAEAFDARGKSDWSQSGQVSVPAQTWGKCSLREARYVRLTRNDDRQSGVYKISLREGAAGTTIWLGVGELGLAVDEVRAVTAKAAGRNAYQWDRLLGSTWGRLTLAGLAIGLVGIGIDAAFDIGKQWLLFPTSDHTAALARSCAYVLKAAGLVIVFLQATWFRRD